MWSSVHARSLTFAASFASNCAWPAVNAPADVPGAAEALARPPAYPTAAGLVRVVPDWTADPAPLVPLYLRRPDAKPQVVAR